MSINKTLQEDIEQELLTEDVYRQKIKTFLEIQLYEERKKLMKTEGKVAYNGKWVSLIDIERLQKREEKVNKKLFRDILICYVLSVCFVGVLYKIMLILLPK